MKYLCGRRMKRNGGVYECHSEECPRYVVNGYENINGRYYLMMKSWVEFKDLDLGFAMAVIGEVEL